MIKKSKSDRVVYGGLPAYLYSLVIQAGYDLEDFYFSVGRRALHEMYRECEFYHAPHGNIWRKARPTGIYSGGYNGLDIYLDESLALNLMVLRNDEVEFSGMYVERSCVVMR